MQIYVYHIEESFVIVDRILPAKMISANGERFSANGERFSASSHPLVCKQC